MSVCNVVLQLLFKEDCSVDDLIDVIEGNRRYVKCLYVYNKASRQWLPHFSSRSTSHGTTTCMSLQIAGYPVCLPHGDHSLAGLWQSLAAGWNKLASFGSPTVQAVVKLYVPVLMGFHTYGKLHGVRCCECPKCEASLLAGSMTADTAAFSLLCFADHAEAPHVLPQVDMCSLEEVEEIAHRANSIPISCSLKLNMDGLLERIWDMMALVSSAWPPDSSSSTQAPLHPSILTLAMAYVTIFTCKHSIVWVKQMHWDASCNLRGRM
jgi:hypothetical protein